MRNNDVDKLVQGIMDQDRRSLARLITLVEARHPQVATAMGYLYNKCGNAFVLGITGPPGAGKSTLTDKIIAKYREQNLTVGVVAIDPSSPFSGGALLGDRVRMMQHATDPDVFIRSVGSRGCYGGLSRATREIVCLMDAFGFDVIIVETVGVGQTELDVMDLADTVIVMFVPESGDVVQTMKAGLTEIADIFVVNKSDREGADAMERELKQMVEFYPDPVWNIPVIKTIAVKGEGLDELYQTIGKHKEYLATAVIDPKATGRMRIDRLADVLSGMINNCLTMDESGESELADLKKEVFSGRLNPYVAAQKILSDPKILEELAQIQREES